MITQERLARYRELKAQAERAAKAVEGERKAILEEHSLPIAEGHQAVEPGAFGMKVETRESRSFSYDGVVDAVGRIMADLIKERLPARSSVVLTVTGP